MKTASVGQSNKEERIVELSETQVNLVTKGNGGVARWKNGNCLVE